MGKEDLFNNLMSDLETTCVGKRRQDFWDLIGAAGVKPFQTGKIVEENSLTDEEAQELTTADDMGEDAEDLLDLL